MKLLTEKQVLAAIQVSRATLNRWVKKGYFPEPRAMGPNRKGWLESDVQTWVDNLPRGIGKTALYA